MSTWAKCGSGALVNLDNGVSIVPDLTAFNITFSLGDAVVKVEDYTDANNVLLAMVGLETLIAGAGNSVTAFSPPPVPTPASTSSPVIDHVTTDTDPVIGLNGTTFHIYGTGFAYGATVTVGGVDATSPIFINDTEMAWSLEAAALAAGTYDVVITNPDTGTDTLAGSFVVT